jgi:hypothetical protein
LLKQIDEKKTVKGGRTIESVDVVRKLGAKEIPLLECTVCEGKFIPHIGPGLAIG